MFRLPLGYFVFNFSFTIKFVVLTLFVLFFGLYHNVEPQIHIITDVGEV